MKVKSYCPPAFCYFCISKLPFLSLNHDLFNCSVTHADDVDAAMQM